MAGDYHGWDEEGDGWRFDTVTGEQRAEAFVIVDFGDCSSRQALSSIMCAMEQFPCRIHLRRTDKTNRMIDQLVKAAVLRIAPVAGTEHDEVGVLGIRAKPVVTKEPWWKFWKK